ncbi:serine/threonine-protein kinase pim-3 [Nematolebias whitei]|uniref:serine/threonine-protein kinase pim-3 n=1 Tax=Nematolebias whitei TaxID=451745 RepID=UPI00189760BA|nr:serine/threonine-protein kinase pim-3 [Nematolebias whitei]
MTSNITNLLKDTRERESRKGRLLMWWNQLTGRRPKRRTNKKIPSKPKQSTLRSNTRNRVHSEQEAVEQYLLVIGEPTTYRWRSNTSPKKNIYCKHTDENGRQLSAEVATMLKLQTSTSRSVGMSAPVSLLDWYERRRELIIVMERPVPAEDLLKYIERNGGTLKEDEAKIILKQLLDAAMHLQRESIFHRDIKTENILIETGSEFTRLRLIDFGMSCMDKYGTSYSDFYGTPLHVPPELLFQFTYSAEPTTVWQLGVVLFDVLHKRAFSSVMFLIRKIRISYRLSEDCRDLLKRCLNMFPEERPTLKELQRHPCFT